MQADQCTDILRVELGGTGHDMAHDSTGNRVFVSVPSLNRILEVNLNTAAIVQNFTLSGQPRGIDLSGDGRTIYAALHGLGDIAVLDTTNGDTEKIDISVELDDDRTWDVAEVSTDRVVVSTIYYRQRRDSAISSRSAVTWTTLQTELLAEGSLMYHRFSPSAPINRLSTSVRHSRQALCTNSTRLNRPCPSSSRMTMAGSRTMAGKVAPPVSP